MGTWKCSLVAGVWPIIQLAARVLLPQLGPSSYPVAVGKNRITTKSVKTYPSIHLALKLGQCRMLRPPKCSLGCEALERSGTPTLRRTETVSVRLDVWGAFCIRPARRDWSRQSCTSYHQ